MARGKIESVASTATNNISSPPVKTPQHAMKQAVSSVKRTLVPTIAAVPAATATPVKRSAKATAAKSSAATSSKASSQSDDAAPDASSQSGGVAPDASSQSDDATPHASPTVSSASSASSAPIAPPLRFTSGDEALPHVVVRKPLTAAHDDYQQIELGVVNHV